MLSSETVAELKGRGFINSKDKTHFSARILTGNGTLTCEQIRMLADAAEKYGSGTVSLTARLSIEIPGVEYDNIEPLASFIQENGMEIGGTGPKVRPIAACKGTVCPHGLIDTQGLADELHERFYRGWHEVKLPAKFKIAVGGCPNNCIKPTINDFGIVGWTRTDEKGDKVPGYRIALGGCWGKTQRVGTFLDGVFTKEQVFAVLEQVLKIWMEEAQPKERFGKYLDRVGTEQFVTRLSV